MRWSLFLALLLGCGGDPATAPVLANTHQNDTDRVVVVPASVALEPGETASVRCEVRRTNGTVIPGRKCSWKSFDSTVVTVAPGTAVTVTLTARDAGSTGVRAGNGGHQDTVAVTVTDPEPPPPPPPPPPPATGCPTSGYLRLVQVGTSAQLATAIGAALPGDQIRLAAGTYGSTQFTITRDGTAANPVTLCGPRTAVVGPGSAGDAFVMNGASHWLLQGFRITGMINHGITAMGGDFNVFDGLEIDNVGGIGIHIRVGGQGVQTGAARVTGNVIRNNHIHHTGRNAPTFGEGIYIGDGTCNCQRTYKTHIHHNTLGPDITAEAIELKHMGDSTLVEFNAISSSAIVVRSAANQILDNTVTSTGAFVQIGFGTSNAALIAPDNIARRNTGSGSTTFGPNRMFIVENTMPNTRVYCDNVANAPLTLGVTCTQ